MQRSASLDLVQVSTMHTYMGQKLLVGIIMKRVFQDFYERFAYGLPVWHQRHQNSLSTAAESSVAFSPHPTNHMLSSCFRLSAILCMVTCLFHSMLNMPLAIRRFSEKSSIFRNQRLERQHACLRYIFFPSLPVA
ncbi:hypothetical protein AcW1_004864 [Taiwanofungus camphoratus]|nr:hypothetical protein AcW2_006127 [Antrodia cinnamomea]KAI0960321.1 hypothetical protein AcW1_004864 [Antrodia cinnamomea]